MHQEGYLPLGFPASSQAIAESPEDAALAAASKASLEIGAGLRACRLLHCPVRRFRCGRLDSVVWWLGGAVAHFLVSFGGLDWWFGAKRVEPPIYRGTQCSAGKTGAIYRLSGTTGPSGQVSKHQKFQISKPPVQTQGEPDISSRSSSREVRIRPPTFFCSHFFLPKKKR